MDLRLIDDAIDKMGNRFKFSVLLIKRARELVRGAAPLVDSYETDGPDSIALREILAEKIKFEGDEEDDPKL